MSLPIFPENIRGFRRRPFFKNPEFATIVQQSPTLVTNRIGQAQNPIWHWELLYEYIKNQDVQTVYSPYTDYQILQGFYMSLQGQSGEFLFNDPTDNSVTTGPLQLLQDPVSGNWYSPIQRVFGGQFYEDITDLNGSISVFENGSPSSTGYRLGYGGLAISGASWAGMYLAWVAEPTAPITATFNFYFRARFEMDESEFEEWINGIWTSGGSGSSKGDVLKLVSSKPSALVTSPTSISSYWSGVVVSGSGPEEDTTPPPPAPGTGTVDLLTWCGMSSPDRFSYHMAGDLVSYFMIDTDAGYPSGFPANTFFWMKSSAGHPWDIEQYSPTYAAMHFITEDGDVVDQPACQAANGTQCWSYSRAYKRFIAAVPILPRNYTLGTPVTINSPTPNNFRRTTNCESTYALINLGDIRAITSGPFLLSWAGTIDSGAGGGAADSVNGVPTIRNDYYYGGKLSTGIFNDKESTFYVFGLGRIAWKYYKRSSSGAYVLQQQSINNRKVSGGSPTPVFPCGTGMGWW